MSIPRVNVDGIMRLVRHGGHFLRAHASTIWKWEALLGIPVTMYTTVKCKELADIRVAELERHWTGDGPIPKIEYVKAAGPAYIPAVISGSATALGVIGLDRSHLIKERTQLALYSTSEIGRRKLEEVLERELSAKKAQEIKDEAQIEAVKEQTNNFETFDENEVIHTGRGDLLHYDTFCKKWFRTDPTVIFEAETQITNMVLAYANGLSGDPLDVEVHVNDLLELIGLPRVAAGNFVGFNADVIPAIRRTAGIRDNGEPYTIISFDFTIDKEYCSHVRKMNSLTV